MNNDVADEWASAVITSLLYTYMLDAFLFKLKCCRNTIGKGPSLLFSEMDVKRIMSIVGSLQ
jgi:hypothetical protein